MTHKMKTLAGPTEVCDTCTNSNGYPVNWEDAHGPVMYGDEVVGHISNQTGDTVTIQLLNKPFLPTTYGGFSIDRNSSYGKVTHV